MYPLQIPRKQSPNNASPDSELRNRAGNVNATFVKLHNGNDNGEVM